MASSIQSVSECFIFKVKSLKLVYFISSHHQLLLPSNKIMLRERVFEKRGPYRLEQTDSRFPQKSIENHSQNQRTQNPLQKDTAHKMDKSVHGAI